MKFICIFCIFLIGTIAADDWENFKTKNKKAYKSKEREKRRKQIFQNNLDVINEHNAEGTASFTLGLNSLGDMTTEEVKTTLNGYKDPPVDLTRSVSVHKFDSRAALPAAVDWRNTPGVVTPVKSQGQCASCWTFSATGALEGQMALRKKTSVSLSEQNILDCAKLFCYGCGGGSPAYAYLYIYSNKGLETETSYPYETAQGKCRYNAANSRATVRSVVFVPSGNEAALQNAVATVGPITVAVDASLYEFQFYTGGVFAPANCNSTNVDHSMLVVGYNTTANPPYWIVKNSWSTEWGMKGYINIAMNKGNMCGIATVPYYPLV